MQRKNFPKVQLFRASVVVSSSQRSSVNEYLATDSGGYVFRLCSVDVKLLQHCTRCQHLQGSNPAAANSNHRQ